MQSTNSQINNPSQPADQPINTRTWQPTNRLAQSTNVLTLSIN